MDRELLRRAWVELHGRASPVDFGDDLITALATLLPEAPVEVADGYSLGGLAQLPADPWRAMIVGREPEASQLVWVLQAAQLLPLGRGPDSGWIVVDLEEDADGQHRVFELSDDLIEVEPLFTSLDELLRWLPEHSDPETLVDDNAAERAEDLEECLGQLWQLHPASLLRRYRAKTWPAEQIEAAPVVVGAPGWRRRALIWTLAAFQRSRTVALPEGAHPEALSPAHLALLERYEDLEAALKLDEVPGFIADLSLDEDPKLVSAALDWMVQFDKARQRGEEQQSTELAEQTKGLLALLTDAVVELTQRELIEVDGRRRPKLVEQLLEVVLKVNNPNLVVQEISEALLDSPYVEEVFASDAELHQTLTRALGMKRPAR